MRIGILANTFEPVFGEAAGGHIHFIEVAKRWHDVDLVVFAPAEAHETMARELPRARFVTMPSTDLKTGSSQIRNLSRVLLGLCRWKELRACDALIASSHFLPDVVPAFAARGGARTVVCIHHILGALPKSQRGRAANAVSLTFQMLSLALLRRFGRLVVANHPETLSALGLCPPRIRVVQMRHGVDHLEPAPAELPISSDALYLGRLVPSKNPEDALEAWAKVVGAFPSARLVIAGGGAQLYVETLRRRVQELGIDHAVAFLGRVSNQQREALYAGTRIFLFPSKEEGWGIALAEAMAHGLPCVTYDLPAFRRDFVGGRMVVPEGNVNQFASAVIEVLGDRYLHARLASEARELARGFRWEEAARVEIEALTLAAT